MKAAEQAQALAETIRAAAKWDPALFPALVSIGRAMGRAPRLVGARTNLGGLLTTLGRLPPAVDAQPWAFDSKVDPHAFHVLDYAAASAGIARTQRENRDGWWTHARHSRAFILNAAARIQDRSLAILFGAVKAFDLPLVELAARFERVVLVDIDKEALADTCATVVRDEHFTRRLELRAVDLSGIAARIARNIEEAIESAPDAATAQDKLEAVCYSYHLAGSPRWLDAGEHADLLVSGMVLSQLALQPKLLAKRLFERRFGSIPGAWEERWSWAWDEFDLLQQQDHINALADYADLVVLTSDAVHQPTVRSAGGSERPRGNPWSVIGRDTL